MTKNRIIGFINHTILVSCVLVGYFYNIPFLEYMGVIYVGLMIIVMVGLQIYTFVKAQIVKNGYNHLSDYEKSELEKYLGYEIIEPINTINLALMNRDVRELYRGYSIGLMLYTTCMQLIMFSALFFTGWIWVANIYFTIIILNLILTQKYIKALRELDE